MAFFSTSMDTIFGHHHEIVSYMKSDDGVVDAVVRSDSGDHDRIATGVEA